MYKTKNRRIIRKYRKLYEEFQELDSFLYCEALDMDMDFDRELYSEEFSLLETLRNRLSRLQREYGIYEGNI
jgi:hypothetical protein